MIVILHGWSDESKSFHRLAAALPTLGIPGPVTPIWLGDYVSMDDDVGFDDLADAMQRAWKAAGLPLSPRSADLIVHSTGGLVARHWMTRHYQPGSNPIRRLLMLAPANFGSHLAHKGTSFLGRVVKGYRSDRLFHTGARILQGLELASGFTSELADRDRFAANQCWYGPGGVLATVLVGTAGYGGISAAANAHGSDGTVPVSAANLNPVRLDFDFASDPSQPTLTARRCEGQTAFCRVPDDNHSTLAYKDRGPKQPLVPELIRRSLAVDDASFDAHCANLAEYNASFRRAEAGRTYTQGFQNTVVQVVDDQGKRVPDYFIEAFAKQAAANREDARLTGLIQSEAIDHVHTNRVDPSSRSLMFNVDRLHELLLESRRALNVAITASPELRDTGTVGYSTISYMDIGSIRIDPADLGRWFQADRTALVRLKLRRQQAESLVRFKQHW